MARPMICRKLFCAVTAKYFKPQDIPMRFLKEVKNQVDAAARMGVSRQTFGNIIARAHKKVATALLCGKALRIAAAGESVECVAERDAG